jgi:division protein CdvB (Snf7/Vps24/ESCRT-III family)
MKALIHRLRADAMKELVSANRWALEVLADRLEYAMYQSMESAEIERGLSMLREMNGIMPQIIAEYDRIKKPAPFAIP